jgi:hypothetical protein
MAVRLKQVLEAVPEEKRGLFHEHYAKRVRLMEETVVPRAIGLLSKMEVTDDPKSKAAVNLLTYRQSPIGVGL